MAQVIYSLQALKDLDRLEQFLESGAAECLLRILDCVETLKHNPEIGRPVRAGYRELVISRGKTGYLALYAYDPVSDLVRILRLRHQREAGYPA